MPKWPAARIGLDAAKLKSFECDADYRVPEPKRIASENEKLGPAAFRRKTAADEFLRATLEPTEYIASRDAVTTAAAVSYVEKRAHEIGLWRWYSQGGRK